MSLDITLHERVKGVESDMANMKNWQASQNGAIHRVEAKVDKLIFWCMTAALGALGSTLIGLILFLVEKK